PGPTEAGGVRGAVCSPDGTSPLADARASITPVGGTEVFDLTDEDGRFLVENVPAGEQPPVITKGPFRQEIIVEITANETPQLDEEECAFEIEDLRIVVVLGNGSDHAEEVPG